VPLRPEKKKFASASSSSIHLYICPHTTYFTTYKKTYFTTKKIRVRLILLHTPIYMSSYYILYYIQKNLLYYKKKIRVRLLLHIYMSSYYILYYILYYLPLRREASSLCQRLLLLLSRRALHAHCTLVHKAYSVIKGPKLIN
jgi:hypothetical protein